MRRSLWPVASAGITTGVLIVLAGAAAGGELGPLAAGYGVLVLVSAVYLAAGLAIRDRVWRRLPALRLPRVPRASAAGRVQGRHIF
ncbi:MAG: hypothetical protein ACRDGV_04760 [Candidatus Limnocylindria bacterium]